LANFGRASFANSSATVNGSTNTISSFPNASINMISKFGATLDTTSALNATGDGFTVAFTGSSSTGGGGHHKHGTAILVGGSAIPLQNLALPSGQIVSTATPVFSVAHPNDQTFFPPTLSQPPQPTAFPGFLIVAPTSREEQPDVLQQENQEGDGPANQAPLFNLPGNSRYVDVPGGTISHRALDDFFADPVTREQKSLGFEEVPALVGSTAPVIDVVAGAEFSALLLGAYLGNPVKAKETEDNTKRKVKWL
jgi:hypothetical protein